MAFRPTTTRQAARANGIKVLCYGPAGAGKTVLCATTGCPDNTLVVSCEAGLLSLRNLPDMPCAEVKTIAELKEVYDFLKAGEHEFQWVCLDSVSEIAEVVLANEKKKEKDPRAAYGNLADHMFATLRLFRDLPAINVYFSAKAEEVYDEERKRTRYRASMPGKQLSGGIAYLFDEVFALRVERDQAGNPARWLLTGPDGQYEAKDRSGALEMYEPPNLQAIAAKIQGDTKA